LFIVFQIQIISISSQTFKGSYLKLEKGDGEEDMMELIDVLTEQKDEKKWDDICATIR
jgi:hypothetical protein